MILGLGIDVIAVETVERAMRQDSECATAWCSEKELAELGERASHAPTVAIRIAAKEAVAKAIGTGFAGEVAWQDVEIVLLEGGVVTVALSAGARAVADRIGVVQVLVSLTQNRAMAAASAVAVGTYPTVSQTIPM